MKQLWFCEILFLFISSLFALSDRLGGRYPSLLSLLYAFRVYRTLRIVLVASGFIIGLLALVFPCPPGPVVLGDFVISLCSFLCAIRYLFEAGRGGKGELFAPSALESVWWGVILAALSVIHFFVPGCVLL